MGKLFVYLEHNGILQCQKWMSVLTDGNGKPSTKEVKQQHKITDEEWKMSLDELKLKYPYVESKENA